MSITTPHERILRVTFHGIHAYAVFVKGAGGEWRLLSAGKPLSWMTREPNVEAIRAMLDAQKAYGLTWEWMPRKSEVKS